jgi:hypothetical protein
VWIPFLTETLSMMQCNGILENVIGFNKLKWCGKISRLGTIVVGSKNNIPG